MESSVARPEVFSRKASGLSRVMSPWSAFAYNFLTMGVIFPWTFVWAPEAFPGCSVWMACLFATLMELPIALAYVWMASGMPRSGGDYVFQSRMLGGAIGFPIVMSGFVVWMLQWIGGLSGWLFCNLGLVPLFMGLGVHYHSTSLINAGIWSESHQGVVIVSTIACGAAAFLLITGFKNYVRLQHAIFAGTAILVIIMLVQFLRTSPASFATAINHFNGIVDSNPHYYTWLQHDVSSTGWNLFPKFALGATLLAAPIAWTSTMWATYSVEQGGEIKGARVFRNQMFIIVGALIAVGVTLALIAWTEQHAIGTGFFNAASASYYGGVSASGKGIGAVLPFPGMFAIIISPNPIIVVLASVGFMLASFQLMANGYIGCTRIMIGMSLDRTLPAWLSKINGRFRTPVNVQVVYFLATLPVIFGYTYLHKWATITLGVTFAGGYVFVFSALAAALLPYRAKALYEAAPGAQYKLFGVPLVTIFGVIGAVFATSAEVAFLLKKGYGLTGTTPYLIVSGVFVVVLVYYVIQRWYQKGKGIDLSYAFLEVPPE